jgi:hypothetical protein
MNNSLKLINPSSYIAPKAQPLTLKEVLQLRDGIEITRAPNPEFSQTIALLSISQSINHLNSLN